MKLPPVLLANLSLLWLPALASGQAEAKEPPELQRIRSRYEADLVASALPVHARYLLELQTLQRHLTQKDDLAAALAIKGELAKSIHPAGKTFQEAPSQSRFSNTRWSASWEGNSKIEFRADGQFREEWGGKKFTGTWKPLSDLEIEVTRLEEGKLNHFKLIEKDKMVRAEDNADWRRAK